MDYNDCQEKIVCFSIALAGEMIENDPRFRYLLDELYHTPGFRISEFSIPGFPGQLAREALHHSGRRIL